MNRRDLMHFALRARNDWSFVPVLRDALLESAETHDELTSRIAHAESWSRAGRNYVVVMEPRMLSPTWRTRKGFDHAVFSIYEFDVARHGSLADLIDALETQLHEPVVPIHGARARGGPGALAFGARR